MPVPASPPIYYRYVYKYGTPRRSRFQVQVFGLWQLATNTAAAGSEVRDYSGDVGSGVAKCDPQSIWN